MNDEDERHSYEMFEDLLQTDMSVEDVERFFMNDIDLTTLETHRLILSYRKRFVIEHLTRIADLYDQQQYYLKHNEKRGSRMNDEVQISPIMMILKHLECDSIFNDLLQIKTIHDDLMRTKFNYVIKVEWNQMFDGLIGSYMNEMSLREFIEMCKDASGSFTKQMLLKAMKSDDEDDL